MIKKILIAFIVLFSFQIVGFGYNYYHPYSNPAHPLHIMNPANPVSPLNPVRQSGYYNSTRRTLYNPKEEYVYRVYRVYEICYKGYCRATTSRELKHNINTCIKYNGGTACLNKVIE